MYPASNHKASSVQSMKESTSLIPKPALSRTRGHMELEAQARKGGLSRGKGEPSPSLAGHLAGCANSLVLQGHRLSQSLKITE